MSQTQPVELHLKFDSYENPILQELHLNSTFRIFFPQTGAGIPFEWEVTNFPSKILSKQENETVEKETHRDGKCGYPVFRVQPFNVIGTGSGVIQYQFKGCGVDKTTRSHGTIRVTVLPEKSAPIALLKGQLVPPF